MLPLVVTLGGMSQADSNVPSGDGPPKPPGRKITAPWVGRPGGRPAPGTLTGPDAAERLSEIAGELAVLSASGSRWADLAVRTLGTGEVDEAAVAAAREQLAQAWGTLDRIRSRVDMSLSAGHIGERAINGEAAVTLGEALGHAEAAIAGEAAQDGARVEVRIERNAGALACGVLYAVLAAGVRNAIESVHARRAHEPEAPGLIRISARVERGRDGLKLVVELWDSGHGPPAGGESWVFRHGYSTRERGAGIGLSLARSLVRRRGGEVELDTLGGEQRGAVLRVRMPIDEGGDAGPSGGAGTGEAHEG